ncbi:Soluble lytic murein transglycosylase precursor [compost metagenome]|uniref:Soluble lytic murein transglycosylase n=1 Tax=Variovorax boronicumulans TaxID=436515 RepID=A0AAW8DQR5_9BURK|nr:lytic transglycosylase domain-containing protein [Variovorax boronicumulans]MDP9877240.1 soluble lytic murein transglycosylase [Variovorax boronicumulans]MDP9915284.1 soluble lytic murein transglycosylase [Variovorax boronicumulans]MDP9921883.1 soluble lytic murein transglycosylase [Variovorax boronicumulans]OEZ31745.1 lytic transglycosylase [Variovorax boronicumulans]GER13064.1 lytic transglycosylase [Variovorax boronicumulans]
MQFPSILASARARQRRGAPALVFSAVLALAALLSQQPAAAQNNTNDDVLVQMKQAFQRGDKARLTALLPQARGHALEPWAAYWELKARLQEAAPNEVQDFYARYPNTYQEDRLRNDWLLLLGQRRDWDGFAANIAGFRMGDDAQVRCYAVLVDTLRTGTATQAQADEVRRNWFAQKDSDDGCLTAADRMVAARLMTTNDAWKKARLAIEANRPAAARGAVTIAAPDALPLFEEVNASAAKFLTGRAFVAAKSRKELVVLALIKIAVADPDQGAAQLDGKWGPMLSAEERNWVWGTIGRAAANKLSPMAVSYFGNVTKNSDLSDDMLGWRVRAALRASQWKDVAPAINAMSDAAQQDPTWVYWKARALSSAGGDERRAQARELYTSIAGTRGFYEMLALEELGQRVVAATRPAPLTPEEKNAARTNPGLQRGLQAIGMGLRSEGTREWNYATNLHDKGGMDDRALLAAADLACQREVWDRCINTSERTKGVIDVEQRFPMPFHDTVLRKSQDIGLDPAYVYGLIRQESRFIMDARSGVGASGLMQVMPATARWTARKIGLTDFTPGQINDRETNITIGTNYLKLALDDFDGSMALAAAAYNAGPGRPRNWRNGPVIDAAIWAENVPFNETRDYVKKVLANTTNYAAIISGKPQSLKERLGRVGPRNANEPEPNKDLP